jgi:hypothetical protein
MGRRPWRDPLRGMPISGTSILAESDPVVLERGDLSVEIALQPFAVTVRR